MITPMAELDTIYIYAIVGGLMITAVYYALRLRIEMKKEQSARASFMSMVKYHSQRLDIETEKLEIARKSSGATKPRDLESIHEEMVRRFPSLGNDDRSVEPTATMGTGKPAMMSDEEFAARIRKIREMGQ